MEKYKWRSISKSHPLGQDLNYITGFTDIPKIEKGIIIKKKKNAQYEIKSKGNVTHLN